MKKAIYLLVAAALCASCAKEEIPMYANGDNCIQFEYGSEQFATDFDFAFQYEESFDEWGYPERSYYGDALQEQQVGLIVSLLGWPSDDDRTFRLKAVEGEGLNPELVRLDESYTLRGGMLRDTATVTLLRPAARGKYKVTLTFDTDGEDADFALGAEEKLTYTFNITDRYPKPTDWDGRAAWLGEYSEEKYAFVVTVINKTYGYYVSWGDYNQQLRDALDEYNAANPDNPKDFTFPVNTGSIWGDY